MKKDSFFKRLGFKKLKRISFGLLASLFLLWLIFNSFAFVPEGKELKWVLTFLSYGGLGSYVFSRQDLLSKLSLISLRKAFVPFVVVFLASLFGLAILLGVVDPFPAHILAILMGIPAYLLLIHAFVFATVETSFWQGILDSKIGVLGSAITAGVFHMFIWEGSLVLNFFGATFLFMVFSYVNYRGQKYFIKRGISKKVAFALALIATIAFHTAYNFIKLGLMIGI